MLASKWPSLRKNSEQMVCLIYFCFIVLPHPPQKKIVWLVVSIFGATISGEADIRDISDLNRSFTNTALVSRSLQGSLSRRQIARDEVLHFEASKCSNTEL